MTNPNSLVPGGARRFEWMDTLRGIAVILVVFNHAVIFAVDAIAETPNLAVLLNSIFAPVRMPLMVFLSGLLLQRSIAKGARTHISGKIRAVLYPFAVWTVLLVGYELATDALRGRAVQVPSLGETLVSAPGHMWFLEYLFVFYLSALALYVVQSWVLAVAALVVAMFAGDEWSRFLVLFAYFFAGHVVSSRSAGLDRLLASPIALFLAGAATTILVGLCVAGFVSRYTVWSVPLVLAAMLLAMKGGQRFAGSQFSRPFQYAGRHSLVFYIGHWFPTLFGVLLTERLLPGQPYWSVVAGLLLGLTTSALISVAHRRSVFAQYFFSLPRVKRAPMKAEQKPRPNDR